MYARNRYRQRQAETANPGELLIMLYDGIIRFLGQAREATLAGEASAAGESVTRALDIISALQATLREDVHEQITASLDTMYVGWMTVLLKATAERDAGIIHQVIEQVTSMRDAWVQAARESTLEVPR